MAKIWTLCGAMAVATLAAILPVQAAQSAPAPALSEEGPVQTLSLAEALEMTERLAPALASARATAEAARTRQREALAAFVPTLVANGAYTRTTANYVLRPGSLPTSLTSSVSAPHNRTKSYNYWNFSLTLNQTVFDSGVSLGAWRTAKALNRQGALAASTALNTAYLNTRQAYFQARAMRQLAEVARDTLHNQERHRQQIAGQVEVGQRPPIDLAQANTDVASAELGRINAEGNALIARAKLTQALGAEGLGVDYAAGDDTLAPIVHEDAPAEELMRLAIAQRPDIRGGEAGIVAQQGKIVAARGSMWPALSAQAQMTEAGEKLDQLGWNWSAGAQLGWNINLLGLPIVTAHEAYATLRQLRADQATLRQNVRLQMVQAVVQIRAGKMAVEAAARALDNAEVQLALAEGRYATGLGSVIELSDAQLALASARGQGVSATQQLAAARAQLLFALGERDEAQSEQR